MKNVNKYNDYCLLVSQLDSKSQELKRVSSQRNRLKYELDSIKGKLKSYKEINKMNPEDVSSIKRLRMSQCLKSVVSYDDGGAISEQPISEFKASNYYKSLSAASKKLFKKIEEKISESQYSLQNAVLIGQNDDENFDVYNSSIIEDYIDESMEEMNGYEETSISNLKELKQIMYKFVEQVSKI